MQKTRSISILAVGLLLSNIALVSYIALNTERIQGRPMHPPQGGGPKNQIIERLHLDKEQVARYEELIKVHRTEVYNTDEQIRALKDELYLTLGEGATGNKDSIVNAITTLQRKMEYVHYDHFMAIKQLCRPEQQQAFNELAGEFAHLFGPPPHKRP
ncbi:hypothetical protein GCM10023093_06490 [Nemorincola caseinilytica]|uniref:Periplasmic heavy metal sensor n=1 Tax=Nemorincola caseinilytica TaxID=2054315 RepID=A0ABP8N9M2_9BACT